MTHPMLAPFLAAAPGLLPAAAHRWFSPEAILGFLSEGIARDLAQIDDEAFARGFQARCPVEGRSWEEYTPRVIEVDPTHRVLAQIRFRRLDVTKPFLKILRTTRPIWTRETLDRVLEALLPIYRPFQPRYLSLFVAEDCAAGGGEPWLPGVSRKVDMHLVGGPVRRVREAEVPEVPGLRLEKAVDLDFYPWYDAIYTALPESRPGLRGRLRSVAAKDLEPLLQQGWVFEVRLEGERVGLVVVEREAALDLPGWCMVERVVDPAVRGRGIGAAMMPLLARALEDPAGELIWGTIHPENPWSWGSAFKAGREALGATWWIPLDEAAEAGLEEP